MSHVDPAKKAAREAGLSRYTSTSPCSYGHVGERLVGSGSCVTCEQARRTKYRTERRDEYLAARRVMEKRRRDGDLEASRELSRQWRANNREKSRECVRISRAKWRLANPEADAEQAKRWRQKNLPKLCEYARTRRSRKLNAGGEVSAEQISDLLHRQHRKCAYCTVKLKRVFHADHIMPLSRGGSNFIGNIQILCKTCNLRKNAMHPTDFARKIGLLL